jgi:hypothetical protein
MKLRAMSVVWVLPFFLTACFHWPHRQAAQPLAPPIQTASKAPPPTVEHPPLNATIPSVPLATGPTVQSAPRPKPPKKRKKPVSDSSEQTAANTQPGPPNTQQAPPNIQQAAIERPGVSAIGQLSSGDTSDLRQQTQDSIAAIERSLNAISSKLSDPDQKIAAQIREYLKQGREALASGDVDGARTLTAKAKVLLEELSH